MFFGFYRPKSSLVVVERPYSEVLLVLQGLKVYVFYQNFCLNKMPPVQVHGVRENYKDRPSPGAFENERFQNRERERGREAKLSHVKSRE